MDELIKIENLKKYFPVNLGFFRSIASRQEIFVKAVDNVSFDIKKKEIFGLAGESGSGKTTTGRAILRLIEPTSGKAIFKGQDIFETEIDPKILRRQMQMIFQDPYESLNPRFTVYDIISEPLKIHKIYSTEKEIEEILHSHSVSLLLTVIITIKMIVCWTGKKSGRGTG